LNNSPNSVSPSTPSDILSLIKNHGPEILAALHKRKEERGVTNADIINLTGVPQSSFYRFWDGDGKNLNPDHISKICLFLGVSIDDFRRDPSDTSIAKLGIPILSHEEVMTNIHAELNKQRETIDDLNYTIEELDLKNRQLEDSLREKTEEIIAIQSKYSDKIEKLTDALLQLHDEMHRLNVGHNTRVDRLTEELSKRHDQQHSLFLFFKDTFAKHPDTLRQIAQKIEE
jgi:DNA-binding Xre family transcriptional regulator